MLTSSRTQGSPAAPQQRPCSLIAHPAISLTRIVRFRAGISGGPIGPEGGHPQAMRLQVRIDGIARKLREIGRQTQAFTDEIEVVDGFGQDTPLRRDPSVTRPTARCRWATPPSGPKEWPPNERIWPARQPGLPPGSRLADRAYGGFREDGAAHPLTGCKSARRAAAPVPALRGRSSG